MTAVSKIRVTRISTALAVPLACERAMVVVTHNMELAALMERQATIVDGRLEYLQ